MRAIVFENGPWGAGLALFALVLALAVNSSLAAPALMRQNATPAAQRVAPFAPANLQQQYTPIKQQQQQQQQQAPLARRQQAPAPSSRFSVREPNAHPRWSKPSAGLNSLANKPDELRNIQRAQAPRVAASAEPVFDDGPDDAAADEEAQLEPEAHEQPPAATEAPMANLGKTSVNEAFSLARDLMNGLQGNGQVKSAGLNFNNQQATIKVGNNKKVNVNQISNHVAPIITNSRFGRLDLASTPSLVVPNKNAQVQYSSVPGEVHGSVVGDKVGEPAPAKVKATPEQKELKRKLLELADKATSSSTADDADLLKFNSQTGQFEAAPVDPKATEYKQKLQDAIKALSAKKLPTERLKEALGGFDSESPNALEGLNFQSAPRQNNNQGFLAPPSMPESDEEMEIEPPVNGEDEELPPPVPEDEYAEYEQLTPSLDEDELPQPDDMEAPAEDEPEPAAAAADEQSELVDPLTQVREILADRLNRISDLLYFRPEFLNQLLQIDDNLLTPIEAEFKRMILCNSDEQFCQDDLTKYVNPDGLLPAPLTDEQLGRAPLPTDEQHQEEHEEVEPELEPIPEVDEEYDDGGLTPPMPPSPFSPAPLPPASLPIAPPAGARRFSQSRTSVNYQYDHAHAHADFGDHAPVVQHRAVARAWVASNGKPSIGATRPSPNVRHQAPHLGNVHSNGPAAANQRLIRRQPSNEIHRGANLARRVEPSVFRPLARNTGGPTNQHQQQQQLPQSRFQPGVRQVRGDWSQPTARYQQQQQQVKPAVAPSRQHEARPTAARVSPAASTIQRQRQQPPQARYGQGVTPAAGAASQHPAMQSVAPQSPVVRGNRLGETRQPIGK